MGKINHKNDFFFAVMNVKNHYLDSFVWIISNTDDQSLSTRHLSFWTKFWKIIPYTDHVNTTFVKWTKFWKTIPYTDNVDTTFVKWTKFWKAIPYTDHVNTTFVKCSGLIFERPFLKPTTLTRHVDKWIEFWKTIPYTDHVKATFVEWTKFWKAIPYTNHVSTTFVKWIEVLNDRFFRRYTLDHCDLYKKDTGNPYFRFQYYLYIYYILSK